MNRPLTAELIRTRTKTDNLFYIKKFTLCNHDLDDVRILRQMPNIEVLSLSVNKINSLKEFANCSKLQELYVRSNLIKDLTEIEYLADLRDLRVLWLSENPCANNPNYRAYVINALPYLESLDKVPITAEERAGASGYDMYDMEPQPMQKEVVSPPPKKNNYLDDDFESHRPQTNNSRLSTPQNHNNRNKDRYEDASDYRSYNPEPEIRYSSQSNNTPVREQARQNPPPSSRNNNVLSPTLKNEHVISAILILLKDIDDSGLKIIKKDVDRRIAHGQV